MTTDDYRKLADRVDHYGERAAATAIRDLARLVDHLREDVDTLDARVNHLNREGARLRDQLHELRMENDE